MSKLGKHPRVKVHPMGTLHVRQVTDADLDAIANGAPGASVVTWGASLLTTGIGIVTSILLAGPLTTTGGILLAIGTGAILAGTALLVMHQQNSKRASDVLARVRVEVDETVVDDDEDEEDGEAARDSAATEKKS